MPYLSVLHDHFGNNTFANNTLNSTCILIYNRIPGTGAMTLMKLIDETSYDKHVDLLKSLYEYTSDNELKDRISSDLDDLNISVGSGQSPPTTPTTTTTTTTTTATAGSTVVQTEPRTGNVDVSIKDKDGDGLKATVVFTNRDTGKSYEEDTGYSGTCTLSNLPCGDYKYEVTKSGYNKYTGTKTIGEYGNSLDVRLEEEESSTPTPQYKPKSSYNKSFFAFVAAVILASLAFYALVNFV
jgi:hypothetical protein